MKKEHKHNHLGLFIYETLKCAKLTMTGLCAATHMGKGTFGKLKKGEDMSVHYYIAIFLYYFDGLTDEEVWEKVHAWTSMFLRYRKKRNDKNTMNDDINEP